ncbi:hypothetical protein CVT26_013454 [Gymnopilus dilepis]|uniref:Cytochrome P450 n=1 Tax=Gymnopilus dilepis TaxID=231916 RepID=A0A409YWT1_9AGAR|nr:hypothetical protein CVT26_013454 [Gymnopilus dilepis]
MTHVQPSARSIISLSAFVVALLIIGFLRRLRRVQRNIGNIPGPHSASWFGNFALLHDATKGWKFFEHIHANYGSICRVTTPIGCNDMLYVTDPMALLHIVRKNEAIFDDPAEIHIMLQMVLGTKGLGSTSGVPDILLLLHIDMSHWGTRVSLELVGQGAVGHSFDPLEIESKPNLYGEDMKQGFVALSTPASRLGMKYILPWVANLRTPAFNRWLLNLVPSSTVAVVRNFIDELDKTSKMLFNSKKKAILQGEDGLSTERGSGTDLMTSLIRDYVLSERLDKMSEVEATSHEASRTLLFAATDTSSSAILRTVLCLAEHPVIQARLRDEILEAKSQSDGDISYEKLAALPLLDAVIRETLRLYPPAPYIDRVAKQDTVLPLSFPITDLNGKILKEIFVPKGTVLTLSIIGANRNTAVWGPDACEWNPERWLHPLPETVTKRQMPGIYSNMCVHSFYLSEFVC